MGVAAFISNLGGDQYHDYDMPCNEVVTVTREKCLAALPIQRPFATPF